MENRRMFTARLRHILLWMTLATVPLPAANGDQPISRPPSVAVYASVGEELITFNVDVDHATLTRGDSIVLPGFVQEAWASASTRSLYVAWSNGGSSYGGSGVEPRGDRHGITAFRVDATGALRLHGSPASLRSRMWTVPADFRRLRAIVILATTR